MKVKTSLIVIILVALLLVILAVATVSADGDCDPCVNYSIALQSHEANGGVVRWTYAVQAMGGKDVSHITIALSDCYEMVSCGPEPCERGLDPTTGIDGVKWDFGPDVGETLEVWFETAGSDARHGDIEAAVKAGRDVCYYQVDGSVCAPNNVVLTKMAVTRRNIFSYLRSFFWHVINGK